HNWCRVTPFGHPGITARLTAPPGLSRPPTSFIGPWCQGIHTSALHHLTTTQRCSHPLYNSQQTTSRKPATHHEHTTRKPRAARTPSHVCACFLTTRQGPPHPAQATSPHKTEGDGGQDTGHPRRAT